MDENDMADVTVTAPSIDMMADIVRDLVEDGLVACGNLRPGVRSIYTWGARSKTTPRCSQSSTRRAARCSSSTTAEDPHSSRRTGRWP